MTEFRVQFHSFQDALDFVSLASVQPFPICVSNAWQNANATSVMALVSLDHRCPLNVSAECSEVEFQRFCEDAARFQAK